MIKCKEDLKNTYIVNDHGELRDLYLDKCDELGICTRVTRAYNMNSKTIGALAGDCSVWCELSKETINKCKKLTLSDFIDKEESAIKTLEMLGYVYHGAEFWEPPVKKPRTSTEYEKVTESIFDLRDEFERGELHRKDGDFYELILSPQYLALSLGDEVCYRKVEKEIDWRDEVREFLESCKQISNNSQLESFTYKGECSDKNVQIENELYDNEFLELCRVTLRANGELD